MIAMVMAIAIAKVVAMLLLMTMVLHLPPSPTSRRWLAIPNTSQRDKGKT
eukprot:NODE_28463_length_476_cov_3.017192.p6 GENE.NODE_28463_length_476_cov_3.017192~~NODE_28463_length_476_cov_3.017192.p6  ORF type:complete len:50 (+),score=12.34 NODE_28463_length_476_cov_3.017192:105-254(+)